MAPLTETVKSGRTIRFGAQMMTQCTLMCVTYKGFNRAFGVVTVGSMDGVSGQAF